MKRSLVLGGGGVTGVAWELGILAGLAEQGVDLTGADTVIGTSEIRQRLIDIQYGRATDDFHWMHQVL